MRGSRIRRMAVAGRRDALSFRHFATFALHSAGSAAVPGRVAASSAATAEQTKNLADR